MTNTDDSFRDKFRTGNTPLTGSVFYLIKMPPALDFIAQVADALTALVIEDNWELGGTVSIEDALDASITALESFKRMDVGLIIPHVRTTIPDWALPCDGTTYLRVDYPDLYAELPSALIIDADHFKTPDLNHARMIRGTITPSAYGTVGGSDSITLTTANMPAHTHSYVPAIASVGAAITGVPVPSAVPGVGVTGNAGAGTAFSAIPGHVKTGWIIVAK